MVYWYSNFVIVLSLLIVCATDEGKHQSRRVNRSDWEPWSSWTACSATCGRSIQVRTRSCRVIHEQCVGASVESTECDAELCPVNRSDWEPWSAWAGCSDTCGPGSQFRTRRCRVIDEQCVGASVESSECDTGLCQVNGSWGNWSAWSSCSATCGSGNMTRTRLCDNPVPVNGGKTCEGTATESKGCSNETMCAVNGSWGNWSAWSSCSVTCGSGNITRTRLCDNPVPVNGGRTCEGIATESTSCSNETMCSVNRSEWEPWSSWVGCSATCGPGSQFRTRRCRVIDEQCVGASVESSECDTGLCQVNGSWGNWSAWSSCSVTCGSGNMTRTRLCDNPLPVNGGRTCEGIATESTSCSNETMCAEKPTISSVTSSPPSPVDGNKVILSCNATGYPTPEVHWTYQDNLGFSYVPPTIHYNPDETQVTIDAYTSTAYGGKWTCFAINSVGTASLGVHI